MTLDEIMNYAHGLGITFTLNCDKLGINAPKGCPADLRTEITTNKLAIIAYIDARNRRALWLKLKRERWAGADETPGIDRLPPEHLR